MYALNPIIGKALRRAALLVFAGAVVLLFYARADLGRHSPRVESVGRLEDRSIDEASGMAASTIADNLLWIINDSGGQPVLYAVDAQGHARGSVFIEGARNRDWEDLAAYTLDGVSRLLVADVGDNHRSRDSYELLVVSEPHPERLNGGRLSVPVERRIVFRYGDGAHDCEAVAVDVPRKRILLLTKRDRPPLLYELPLEPLRSKDLVVAEKIAAVDTIPPPTAADLLFPYGDQRSSPTALDIDAKAERAIVLTYKHAYLYTRHAGQGWPAVFGRTPETLPLPLPEKTPRLRQRETICFSRDGRSAYVTSEGRHAGFFEIRPLP